MYCNLLLYYNVLYDVVRCTAMYYCTIMYYTMWYDVLQFNTVLQCTIRCGTMYCNLLLYYNVHNVHNIPQSTVYHSPLCTTVHCVPQLTVYHSVPQCTTMYYSVLQCTTVYHSVPQCTKMHMYLLKTDISTLEEANLVYTFLLFCIIIY